MALSHSWATHLCLLVLIGRWLQLWMVDHIYLPRLLSFYTGILQKGVNKLFSVIMHPRNELVTSGSQVQRPTTVQWNIQQLQYKNTLESNYMANTFSVGLCLSGLFSEVITHYTAGKPPVTVGIGNFTLHRHSLAPSKQCLSMNTMLM